MVVEYGLGFMAGALSLLAPCVLPLTPVIFAASLRSSKWGPLGLALGLTFSFSVFGILTSLFSSLFDFDVIRNLGAILLILVGVVFLTPRLRDLLTENISFLSRWGNHWQGRIRSAGFMAEFLMGVVLGMVWGPCSGPTLAFAFGIATQAEQALQAVMIFFFFGLGAGLGLVTLGLLLKRFSSWTGFLMQNNLWIQRIMGSLSIAVGVLILSGQLAGVEEFLLQLTPDWINQLSTKF